MPDPIHAKFDSWLGKLLAGLAERRGISLGSGSVANSDGSQPGFWARFSDGNDVFAVAVAATIQNGRPSIVVEQFEGQEAGIEAQRWVQKVIKGIDA